MQRIILPSAKDTPAPHFSRKPSEHLSSSLMAIYRLERKRIGAFLREVKPSTAFDLFVSWTDGLKDLCFFHANAELNYHSVR